MINIAKFSPAESLLILGRSHNRKQLLKVTFMHLLLHGALEIKTVVKKPDGRAKEQTYKYVVAGKNFESYTPAKHEEMFLNFYKRNRGRQILFRNFVKLMYEDSRSLYYYRKLILKNEQLNGLVSQNIINKLFGNYSYTVAGEKAKSKANEELKNADTRLNGLIKSDPEMALNLMLTLGTNIVLLENLDLKLIAEVARDWKDSFRKFTDRKDDHDHGEAWIWWWMDSDTDTLDGHTDLFDSHGFDGVNDGFDMDFDYQDFGATDTGCGGCGGCGSCGGCITMD